MRFEHIVFDAYGTLFQIEAPFRRSFETILGENTGRCFDLWRKKYFEYTMTQSHFANPDTFESITKSAMRYCLDAHQVEDTETKVGRLFETYSHLDPFPDAVPGLAMLSAPLWVYSNGTQAMLDGLKANSGTEIVERLTFVSTEKVKTFKPARLAYEFIHVHLEAPQEKILFVSSNGWDVIGAKNYGFPVAWINRAGGSFELNRYEPDFVFSGVDQLGRFVEKTRSPG